MKVIITENRMKPLLRKLLNMLFEGFDDIYYDWANYNCGMGECCDPYAIGFTLPKSHYDDYLFKLVDDLRYEPEGRYPKEISAELPEVCYEQPDITNHHFDIIIFDDDHAEKIRNVLGHEKKWSFSLLDLINDQFGCNARKIVFV